MKTREIDTRKFKRVLSDMGFSLSRIRGSHEIWERSDGKNFSFPANCKTVKAGIVWNFIRAYKNLTIVL